MDPASGSSPATGRPCSSPPDAARRPSSSSMSDGTARARLRQSLAGCLEAVAFDARALLLGAGDELRQPRRSDPVAVGLHECQPQQPLALDPDREQFELHRPAEWRVMEELA